MAQSKYTCSLDGDVNVGKTGLVYKLMYYGKLFRSSTSSMFDLSCFEERVNKDEIKRLYEGSMQQSDLLAFECSSLHDSKQYLIDGFMEKDAMEEVTEFLDDMVILDHPTCTSKKLESIKSNMLMQDRSPVGHYAFALVSYLKGLLDRDSMDFYEKYFKGSLKTSLFENNKSALKNNLFFLLFDGVPRNHARHMRARKEPTDNHHGLPPINKLDMEWLDNINFNIFVMHLLAGNKANVKLLHWSQYRTKDPKDYSGDDYKFKMVSLIRHMEDHARSNGCNIKSISTLTISELPANKLDQFGQGRTYDSSYKDSLAKAYEMMLRMDDIEDGVDDKQAVHTPSHNNCYNTDAAILKLVIDIKKIKPGDLVKLDATMVMKEHYISYLRSRTSKDSKTTDVYDVMWDKAEEYKIAFYHPAFRYLICYFLSLGANVVLYNNCDKLIRI